MSCNNKKVCPVPGNGDGVIKARLKELPHCFVMKMKWTVIEYSIHTVDGAE